MEKSRKGKEKVKRNFPQKRKETDTTSEQKVKKRTKRDAVERALKNIKDLTKLASNNDECLPYGHMGWNRKEEQERVPVPKETLEKYSRGEGLSEVQPVNSKLKRKEKEILFAIEQAARTEILLTEELGFLETDEGETSTQFTQKEIVNSVDISSASKHFQLELNVFGPYRINYTFNGRNLLLGGRQGHVAAFDWVTKKPGCEMNVMEEVFDVQWLHNELMFAVAQKKWVYIYDNQGVELHCLKNLHNVLRMEFLRYHFLLACTSSTGYISWLDTSIGKLVSNFPLHQGRLNIMTHNPYNAVICVGHPQGTVSMWSPNSRQALAKILCHNRPLQAIAINPNGMYMATSAIDSSVKIWDLRHLKGPLQDYRMHGVASNLAFSDKSILALSLGNIVEVYRDCCATTAEQAYLRCRVKRPITDLQFSPFEDVLGIGSGSGFSSMIIPGAGEPNFDALECNPYQSKRHRQEAEVKALLEKIQPELITLDPYTIGDVNVPTLKEKLEAKKKLMVGELPSINFVPRRKSRLKGSLHATIAKKAVKDRAKMEYVKALREISEETTEKQQPEETIPYSALNRFLPKKKK